MPFHARRWSFNSTGSARILSRLLPLLLIGAAAPAQDPNDLKADVSFLASDALQGRATPSYGLNVAAEYIASRFRAARLEPVGDDEYFQTALYNSVTPNPEGLEVSIDIGGVPFKADGASIIQREPVAADLHDIPMIRVSLVEPDALAKLTVEEVRGKVLFIDLPQGRFAGGLLAAIGRLEPALVMISRGNQTGPQLRDAAVPAPKAPVLIVSDAAIRDALAKDENAAVTVSAHIAAPTVSQVKARNVAALLRGTDPQLKDTVLIVTAHYDHLGVRGAGEGDHIYNGANDDASGTASVIAIARALAGGPAPRRSILFMTLFGEEIGGLGSRFYTSHPLFPPAKSIADINLEQLGRTDDTEGSKLLQFNLTGFDYTDIAATLLKAGEANGVNVLKHEKNSDAFFARSDNASFADIGIPSTTVSVSYVFPDYHKPGDEWEKLDYDNMAKVDRALSAGIAAIANNTDAPHWNRDNPKTARYIQAREK